MSQTILLVEDSETDEKLTTRALKKSGLPHDLVVVRDGAEALDWLFRTGTHARRDPAIRLSLILLDLNLPRVDGHEVLKRLRADPRTRFVPVVMLTASREEQDIERCYALGANAYVRKSIDFQEFAANAKTLATFWLTLNEAAP